MHLRNCTEREARVVCQTGMMCLRVRLIFLARLCHAYGLHTLRTLLERAEAQSCTAAVTCWQCIYCCSSDTTACAYCTIVCCRVCMAHLFCDILLDCSG